MIIVVADDLSGAAELANAAVAQGLTAEVQLRFNPATRAEVICLDTESRSLAPPVAAAQMSLLARALAAAQPEWVYQKCDSVLRGPVAAEARALAGGLGKQRVLLIPANPSRARIIRNGEYFVDGVPLAETAFAADPEHPRRSSRVTELVGAATGIETPDAVSAADLARHAAMVEQDTLAAGAVDFFTALLASRWTPRPGPPETRIRKPALFVCGSHAAWQTGRSEQCRQRKLPVCVMPPALFNLELGEAEMATWVTTAAARVNESSATLLAIGGQTPGPGLSPSVLTDRLATAVAGILQQRSVACLLLEGGATAAAVISRLRQTRFAAQASPGVGVGALQPVDGPGPSLLIKPGSYPWPESIWSQF